MITHKSELDRQKLLLINEKCRLIFKNRNSQLRETYLEKDFEVGNKVIIYMKTTGYHKQISYWIGNILNTKAKRKLKSLDKIVSSLILEVTNKGKIKFFGSLEEFHADGRQNINYHSIGHVDYL